MAQERKCARPSCGKTLEHGAHHLRRFCDEECKSIAKREEKGLPAVRLCEICKSELPEGTHHLRRFCTRCYAEGREGASLEAKLLNAQTSAAATRREVTNAKRELEATRLELDIAHQELALYQTEFAARPEWMVPPTDGKDNHGTLISFLSDVHAGEVVNAPEMDGYNAYNLDICEQRLHRFFTRTIRLARDFLAGVHYDGIVLPLGGDMVSGDIHDELIQTNEVSTYESVEWLVPRLVEGIQMFAEEFGRCHVVSAPGNHGRNSKKPRAKGRSSNNADTHIARLVALHFSGNSDVTFDVPTTFDVAFQIYQHRFTMEHGEQMRYNGTSEIGALGPVKRGTLRKKTQLAAEGKPFDYNMIAHFHQYVPAASQEFVMNGCFPAGTWISTPAGPVVIEDIQDGDVVLSRDGSYQKVTAVMPQTSEQGLVVLKVRGLPEELRATPNHEIWAIKGEATKAVEPKRRHEIGEGDMPQWIPADFISSGDWVQVPRIRGRERPFSVDMAWVYGLFLAECHTLVDAGSSAAHNRIEWSMHINELPTLERVKTILDDELNRQGRIWTRPGKTTSHLNYSGRDLSVAWRDMFGHGAHNKHVPESFLSLAPDLAAAVVQGWIDGDGHTRPDGVTSATTVSQRLAYDMFALLLSSGGNPSLAMMKPGGWRLSRTWTIHCNAGQETRTVAGEVFYRVEHRFRNRVVAPVYDLEVSGEHTYTANLVGVHNSLKGYDEYARTWHFKPEPAQQALMVVVPEHGITQQMPVIVGKRSEEGW